MKDIQIDIDATKRALAETQSEIALLVEKFKTASSNLHSDVGQTGTAFSGNLGMGAINKWDENNETAFNAFNRQFDAFELQIDSFIRNNASFQSEVNAEQAALTGTGATSTSSTEGFYTEG